jgi:anti-sigma regulatory factor (Ser/Thr protein kinase)
VWGALPAVPPEVVEDMAMAVNELVLNAWQAGSRRLAVRCWRTDGEVGALVDDDGPGIDDALAGYRRPDPGAERGRGLWLARQLVDVLDTCATDDGTRARVRVFDATWTKSAA